MSCVHFQTIMTSLLFFLLEDMLGQVLNSGLAEGHGKLTTVRVQCKGVSGNIKMVPTGNQDPKSVGYPVSLLQCPVPFSRLFSLGKTSHITRPYISDIHTFPIRPTSPIQI